MKRETYEAIVANVESQVTWDPRACIRDLSKAFPCENIHSLESIVAQCYQERIKKTFKFRTSPREVEKRYKEYQERVKSGSGNGIIVDIAKKYNFSPQLTSKYLIVEWLKRNSDKDNEFDLNERAKTYVKNSNLIPDAKLAYEVYLASLEDDMYGSLAEAIKSSIGLEHEQFIKEKLDELEIPYQDEKYFRHIGCDKTPDIKLVVPFAIGRNVVNWIESKALFGDENSHALYIQNQLSSYWNRFGPGLVIYWFGFVDEINSVRKHEGILVSDSFPVDVTKFDPLHGLSKETPSPPLRDPEDEDKSDSEDEKDFRRSSDVEEEIAKLSLN